MNRIDALRNAWREFPGVAPMHGDFLSTAELNFLTVAEKYMPALFALTDAVRDSLMEENMTRELRYALEQLEKEDD